MIYKNIYETIGNTPIIKLNRVADVNMAEVLVKVESFNPGSSIKDRVALNMIEDAENKGVLKAGDTIIEPTSGNTGIGLAMVGAAKGYKVIIVMPETMSIERRKLMSFYGAELILTEGSKGMPGAIEVAEKLANEKGYFLPQQFKNLSNPAVHVKTTAKEILAQTDGKLDVFIAGVGTGGTITGVGKVLKENIPGIKIVAVEPESSPVLSGGNKGAHKIQGIGAGFVPDILDMNIIDEIIKVKDEDAMQMSRKLGRYEAILAGISSGAAAFAAVQMAKKMETNKRILAILPDTGERYISTDLFNLE